jgi:hypothetical protein
VTVGPTCQTPSSLSFFSPLFSLCRLQLLTPARTELRRRANSRAAARTDGSACSPPGKLRGRASSHRARRAPARAAADAELRIGGELRRGLRLCWQQPDESSVAWDAPLSEEELCCRSRWDGVAATPSLRRDLAASDGRAQAGAPPARGRRMVCCPPHPTAVTIRGHHGSGSARATPPPTHPLPHDVVH